MMHVELHCASSKTTLLICLPKESIWAASAGHDTLSGDQARRSAAQDKTTVVICLPKSIFIGSAGYDTLAGDQAQPG